MAVTKSSVRKSMDAKRKRFLKAAKTPSAIRFGNDRDALNFACWYYYHNYSAWMGNYIGLSDISYDEIYDLFTHKPDYEDMMGNLKEEYQDTKDAESKTLMELARLLRKRYGRK